jgi:hypothetical protein
LRIRQCAGVEDIADAECMFTWDWLVPIVARVNVLDVEIVRLASSYSALRLFAASG